MLLKAIEDNQNEVLVERTDLIYGGRYPMARALLQVRDLESGPAEPSSAVSDRGRRTAVDPVLPVRSRAV